MPGDKFPEPSPKFGEVENAQRRCAADAGKSIRDARRMHPNFGKQGAAGGDSDATGSTLGTEDGSSASQISSGRRIGRKGDGGTFCKRRGLSSKQEVVQAQMDLDKLMQEAPLPVKPVLQVNVCLV